ncbi:MAG: hypothetical protein WKH64_15945, partial [Chloroflexia bacterium]
MTSGLTAPARARLLSPAPYEPKERHDDHRHGSGTELRVGDFVTEVSPPEGPFYWVIGVAARTITVDARGNGNNEPLPITLPVTGTPASYAVVRDGVPVFFGLQRADHAVGAAKPPHIRLTGS